MNLLEMSPPLVSVCIPTYNGSNFLAYALESISIQTYLSIEVIVSDDGSQDKTLDIAFQYSAHPIRIYAHGRLGPVENWNFCIRQAAGKYIKFLFQDDYLESTCIQRLVTAAEADPGIGLVFSPRYLKIDDDLGYASSLRGLHLSWSHLNSVQQGLDLLKDPALVKVPYNKIGEPTNTLISKQVFDAIGIFDPFFQQLPDLEMWFRIMQTYQVAFVSEPLSTFRVHREQETARNSQAGNHAWQEVYWIWMKMLNHPDFSELPHLVRFRVKKELYVGLAREFIHSVRRDPWKRIGLMHLIRCSLMS
ncbi:MAG: glycosyltransferase family 2 protein [Synechococcales cyanobacterium RU_4_20]|nr:glycosyltransferase family 2 protein [Synechococcales cyanobacterium RU_4_20]NJR69802.1 glycosyltransferase family 2 protein [Synechococcales cyanobacterium CRU_2_2]